MFPGQETANRKQRREIREEKQAATNGLFANSLISVLRSLFSPLRNIALSAGV